MTHTYTHTHTHTHTHTLSDEQKQFQETRGAPAAGLLASVLKITMLAYLRPIVAICMSHGSKSIAISRILLLTSYLKSLKSEININKILCKILFYMIKNGTAWIIVMSDI